MPLFYWALLLLVGGFALAALEFFLPSAGILGVLSALALVSALVLGFYHDAWTGLGFLAAEVLLLPVVFYVGIRWWPQSAIGRRILLSNLNSDEVLPDNDHRRRLKELVGKVGISRTLMMPSGAIEVDGDVFDAVSESLSIERGQNVRVIEVHGSRVVVRATDDAYTPTPSRDPSDPLSKSIEEFGFDPFDDPLK